jgi:hypothetical protein
MNYIAPANSQRPPGLYVLTSALGVGGYLGGLVAAAGLDDAPGDVVRAAAIGFLLVMGFVRELLKPRPERARPTNLARQGWNGLTSSSVRSE